MEKLVWHPEKRVVKDLHNWTKNPRKISRSSFLKLKERITKRGFHDVLKIDQDGTVLSGNQRRSALMDLGITEVITLVPSRPLTEEEKNKVALESNFNDGEWDIEELKNFDLGTLLDLGFDQYEAMSSLWAENLEATDDEFDVEEELEKIKKPKTEFGDLICLGNHKLICGDSTDKETLWKLFGEERASMIYSDPVYNLKIKYDRGIGGKRNYGGNVNDDRTDEEYREFLKKSLLSALDVIKKDFHVFYYCDQTYIWLIQTLYRELGIENKRVCIWLKNQANPTPGVAFSKCYEPAVYGLKGSPYIAKNITTLNEVMNKELSTGNALLEETFDHLDIWGVKRLSGKDYEHATQKPPRLHEKAIRRCTRPGEIILDSFSGSGSTMIAAEQLKRRVFGVEKEPIYCDLQIRRYQKLTGKTVKLIKNPI